MSPLVTGSPLPSRHAVRRVVEDLVGRPVQLVDGKPVPAKATNVVAVFVTDRLAVAAVAVLTLECAARLGGALGMLPRGGVDDAIAERALTGMLRDSCFEVLNVLASVFNVGDAPHVRLYAMYGPSTPVPGDVASLVAVPASRMDVSLTVAGYGDGLLSIVVR